MRILVIMGSDRLARSEAGQNSSRDVVVKMRPSVVARKGDTEVHYRAIRSSQDVQMFRGQRFDLIIEDCSFNPERSWAKGDLLTQLQIMVLR